MRNPINAKVREIKPSGIRRFFDIANEIPGVISLGVGEPDFDTPWIVRDEGMYTLQKGRTFYTANAGLAELRQEICRYLERRYNLHYSPEDETVVTVGGSEAIDLALRAMLDPGDEVVYAEPCYVSYLPCIVLADGVPVAIPLQEKNQFRLTKEELEAAITPKTKLFMFSSPCNPSGAVYNKAELAALAAVFEKHPDILIISDEIYEYINFVNAHESIAQFASIKDRIIIVNGLSKGFAMTGWRLGYIAANPEIAKACEKLQGQFTSGPTSVTQKAAVVALTTDLRPTHDMVKEFTRRRTRVLELIKAIPGINCSEPDGAFYIFPDVHSYFGKSDGTQTITNANDFCMYLLNTAHVSSVMGDAFGEPNCVRFSFANSMEKIEEGFRRIAEALSKLK